MRLRKISIIFTIAITLLLTACSSSDKSSSGEKDTIATPAVTKSPTDTLNSDEVTENTTYPITIQHAFGETIITSKPERVVTISWGNQDVPLALGVIPVGVSEANYGVTDGSGLLPWTAEAFKQLGVENPLLFKDTAGLDYEAISNAEPDIILAAYSGISKEEYELLSAIAPVVAYPEQAWQTYWRDQIMMNANSIGMKAEGEQLVADLEQLIQDKTSQLPQLKDKTAAFFYFNPSDLGKFYVYLPSDPRAAYLTDLGMVFPNSVLELAEGSASFALELSAEGADRLSDVDVMITYGSGTLLEALQQDALLGTIPAVKRGSVAIIQDGTPLAASGTPSALSIQATIDEYLSILGEAADKVE